MSDTWVSCDRLEMEGKAPLAPGREFSIPYQGRFIFQRFVTVPATGEAWVTAYGGKRGEASVRSFSLDKVVAQARVHRDRKKRDDLNLELAGRNGR